MAIDSAWTRGDDAIGGVARGRRPELEVIDLPAFVTGVTMSSDQVVSVCPITGQPDWYTVRIELAGSRLGLESRSLKFYLQSFRDDCHFCEQLADAIANDAKAKTGADQVRVRVAQRARGGVAIEATAVL
jgi:7-cyano-7-deazaguanine reductase